MSIHPHADNPGIATIRDDQTNEVIGGAWLCRACDCWIDVLSHAHLHGAFNEHGRWRCKGCIIARRSAGGEGAAHHRIEVRIPEEYADASVNNLAASVRSVASGWPKKYPYLVVCGNPGSGKTRITWAYYKAAVQKQKYLLRLYAPDAQRLWNSKLHFNEKAALEQVWENAYYLAFDDISACTPSDAWSRVLHMLIDARRMHSRPMIITTAWDKRQIAELYGQAIFSRLEQFEWIELDGTDWRARKYSSNTSAPAGSIVEAKS